MTEKKRTFTFNFSPLFVDKVAAGAKLQTVRAWRKDGKVPRPGDRVRLYAGLRTRKARLLVDSVVVECFPVTMNLSDDEHPLLVSNGIRLHRGEATSFAQLDGFPGFAAMADWFKRTHGEEFDGFCVRWRRPLVHTCESRPYCEACDAGDAF